MDCFRFWLQRADAMAALLLTSPSPSNSSTTHLSHRYVDVTPGGVPDADMRARDQLLGVAGRVVASHVVAEGEKLVGYIGWLDYGEAGAVGRHDAGRRSSLRFVQLEILVNKTRVFGAVCFATSVGAQSCILPPH